MIMIIIIIILQLHLEWFEEQLQVTPSVFIAVFYCLNYFIAAMVYYKSFIHLHTCYLLIL